MFRVRMVPLRAAILVVLLVATQLSHAQRVATQPLAGYAGYCERALRDLDCRGVSVAVVKDDQIVFVDGFGECEQGTGKAVDMHTLFSIGSITKGMTTALLAMLVAEGKLSWDDRVLDHLPDFTLYDKYAAGELIIRDMLSHRSGLTDHAGDLLFLTQDHAGMIHQLRLLSPVAGFRSEFAYQNIMYLAAGQMIERIEGRSWDDVLKDRILTPLGMANSDSVLSRFSQNQNIALGHLPYQGHWLTVGWDEQIDFDAAGAVASSAWDMAQWLRALLRGGSGPDGVSWDLKTLTQTHLFLPISEWTQHLYRVAQFMGCGLGWFSYDYYGHRVIEHSGNLPGLSAKLAFIPEAQLGVVVLCNQHESLVPHALLMRVIDQYLGIEPTDWVRRMSIVTQPVAGGRPQDRTIRPSSDSARYIGTYRNGIIGEVKVTQEQGHPVLLYGPNATGDLSELQQGKFQIFWRQVIPRLFPGELQVQFSFDNAGRVNGMIIEGLAGFDKV